MANSLINQGDAVYLLLDFTVKITQATSMSLYEFVQSNNVTEIELALNNSTLTLSRGEIQLDEVQRMYFVAIPQEISFELRYITRYQLRLKRGDFLVCSTKISQTYIGDSLSREVI